MRMLAHLMPLIWNENYSLMTLKKECQTLQIQDFFQNVLLGMERRLKPFHQGLSTKIEIHTWKILSLILLKCRARKFSVIEL